MKQSFSKELKKLNSDREFQEHLNDFIRRAKKHNYKYINPTSVKRILGKWAPVSVWNFSYLLEMFLSSMNETGSCRMDSRDVYFSDLEGVTDKLTGIGTRLLKSNEHYKSGRWNLFNDIDFDIRHMCIKGQVCETYVMPYFSNKELQRSKEESRVVVHATVAEFEGTPWTISFPLQYIMKGFPKPKNEHFGYAHKIALLHQDGSVDKEYAYIGVTSRDWLKRMNEHFNEIRTGSNKLFHRTWREFTGEKSVMLSSELIIGDHTYEQIMSWEEEMVDRSMSDNVSLNMIPGGFKGMKYLHKHRLLSSEKVGIDVRDKAITEFQKLHPRAGIANVLISDLWKDDAYAAKIICGADDRLSIEQVIKIRELFNEGVSVEKICQLVEAKNTRQVQKVINGKTYSRIH